MSSRLESQLNTSAVPSVQTPAPTHTPPTAPNPNLITSQSAPPPVKKAESNLDKPHSKSRKDKKSSSSHQHKDRPLKSSGEDNKLNKFINKSSERGNRKPVGKRDKSPSKKGEEKVDRKSKIDDLFSSIPLSPAHLRPGFSNHSPSKSHSKKEQTSLQSNTAELSPRTNFNEILCRKESSPKRMKSQDKWPQSSHKTQDKITEHAVQISQAPKTNLDVKVSQNLKQPDSVEARLSPESLDSSADMLDEDVEKIVKIKINRFVLQDSHHVEDSAKSPKSLDDSPDTSLEDIVKHPLKQMKIYEINKPDDNLIKSVSFAVPSQNNARHTLETNTMIKNITLSVSVKPSITNSAPICKSPVRSNESPILDVHTSATKTITAEHSQGQQSKTLVSVEQRPVPTSSSSVTCAAKDKKLLSHVQENQLPADKGNRLSNQEETKHIEEEVLYKIDDNKSLYTETHIEEVSSTINTIGDNHNDINERFLSEEVVMTETAEPEQNEYEPKPDDNHISSTDSEQINEIQKVIPPLPPSDEPIQQSDWQTKDGPVLSSNYSEKLTLSPRNVSSPIGSVSTIEAIHERDENISTSSDISSPQNIDKRIGSPVPQDKKARKGEKPSIMEQLIADAEKHEASPSPPPPPVISDKFKEIKQSSLSRLRRVGRLRDELDETESPEPADVDLRTQIQPPTLIKDPKSKHYFIGLLDSALQGIVDFTIKFNCIKYLIIICCVSLH